MLVDVGDHRRAETCLAERNAQLDLAGKIARIGSFTYDHATQKADFSPGCAVIYGLPEGKLEISREVWRALVHPDDLRRLDVVTRRALANRETELVSEFRILRHGEVRWIESRALISYNEVGRAFRRIGVQVDVTDRKRAEDALHQRETELVEAQRLARIGSWHWDAESDVIVGSAELLRIFGLDPATQHLPGYREQRGRWYPVEDWKRLLAAMRSTMQTGVSYELELRSFRTGTPIWIIARGAAVRNSTDRIVGLRGTIQEITERKQAELALAERNAQLALAAKAARVGCYANDLKAGLIAVSEGYVTIHGLPEGTVQTTLSNWRSRVHPDDLAAFDKLREQVFGNRQHEYMFDYRLIRADGGVRWIESRGCVSYDEDGQPQQCVGINIDVTERKQSQVALEESEARYRSLYDDNPSMYFTVDASGTVLSVNEFGARQLGYTPAELVGQSVLEMIHEGDREKARRWLASCAESAGAISRAEMRKVRRDGSILWVRKLARAVDGFGGKLLFIVCEDITERKQAELALAEREAQLGLAGQAARVGSFVIDFATGQIQTSPGFAAIHGLAEESEGLTCEKWRACVLPEDLAHFEALRSRTLAEQRRELNIEYRVVGADGEARWIELRGLVSYDDDGCPTRLVGVHIDITERKRAEEHLQAMNAELDHRVKNVLATASAVASQTLNATSSSEQFVSAFDGRLRSMAQTHELLSERLWRGIPLGELLRRELEPYCEGNNSEIGGPEVILTAEAGQTLAMVFHELSTNAAKHGAFSSQEGRVSVEWRRQLNGDASAGLVIEWRETGGPPAKAECKTGYGTRVICELIPHELAGKVIHVLTPEGARCQLEIPGRWIDASTPS